MPNPRKKLAGKTFGQLEVLRVAPSDKQGNTQWRCRCTCGNEVTVRYNHLSTGATKSCGCSKRKPGRSLDTFDGEAFWS